MTLRKSLSYRIGWLVLAFACGTTALGQERQEIRRTVDLNPGATVSLDNVSGNITITSWAGTQVEIVAVKTGAADKLKEVDISIEAQPSRLSIETVYPKNRNNNVSVSYDLKVPRGVNLDSIKSVSGSVKMTDIDGRVVGRSVSGSVEAQRIGREVNLNSVSGDVRVLDVAGRASVNTVSGNAYATNIKGDLDAKSVSGNVKVTQADGYVRSETVSGDVSIGNSNPPSLKATTVSGDVQFDGKVSANGRFEMKSHSGSVVISLPADSSFALEASTFSGSVKSDFDMKIRELNGMKSVRGTVGSGGATLAVSSFSGSVSIRRQ